MSARAKVVPAREAPFLASGAVLAGDFRIVRELDHGGMGTLYIAEQLSTGKHRALKVMRSGLFSDPEHQRRFLDEAKRAARIKSDHVVEVISAGIDPATEMPWLAMELLEGETLERYVARRDAMSSAEVCEIANQMGHALVAAHAVGIVHRDLKPENIFICAPLCVGVPFTLKVIDFGIAVSLHDRETAVKGSRPIGSALWMAPEQLKATEMRRQTDVWAIGLIFYWLLTGAVYWRHGNRRDAGVNSIYLEILLDGIEPASVRAGRHGLQQRLPSGFDTWFARCVARNPRERFADARAAFEALRLVLSGSSSQRPGGTLVGTPVGASRPPPPLRPVLQSVDGDDSGAATSWIAWVAIALVIVALIVTLLMLIRPSLLDVVGMVSDLRPSNITTLVRRG